MILLAIDPGRGVKPSIGYALFRVFEPVNDAIDVELGELTWDGLVARLTIDTAYDNIIGLAFQPQASGVEWLDRIVIENFVNDPGTRRGGQTNGASEVIGAVEFVAQQAGVPVVRQPRTILPVAKLHAQYVDCVKKLPHADAAYLHGHHWLVGQGILQPVGLEATIKKESS